MHLSEVSSTLLVLSNLYFLACFCSARACKTSSGLQHNGTLQALQSVHQAHGGGSSPSRTPRDTMTILRSNLRRLLLVLVALLVFQSHVYAQAPERNITIPTPTSQVESANSSSTVSETSGSSVSQNITATGNRNSSDANSTISRTSSEPDPTKPFATDFQTQTYRVPAPAAEGGGAVAQSPDDSVGLS